MASPIKVVQRTVLTHPPGTPQPTPCRLWQGAANGRGYGSRRIGGRKQVLLHRWVVAQIDGWDEIEGKVVMHLCDNPPCFRYDHLRIGTAFDNQRDCQDKGRRLVPTGELNGRSVLSSEDVLTIRSMHHRGQATQRQLSEMFGVSRTTIHDIIHRKKWKHLVIATKVET